MQNDDTRFMVHVRQTARWMTAILLSCVALSVAAEEPATATAGTNQVTVSTGKVLASVNGVELRTDDLVVIAPPDKSVTIEANRYRSLVERWIDQELIVQEAKAQGITLTADEQAYVDASRKILMDVPLPTEKDRMIHANLVRTQMRYRSASMFMKHLLEKRGEQLKPVTEDEIEAYYQAHKAEYPALPEDPKLAEAEMAKIRQSIQRKLERERTTKYGEAQRKYLGELRSKAKITN